MAQLQNLTIDQGSTYVLELSITETSGAVSDLTNVTEVRMQIRRQASSGTPLVSLTMTGGDITIDTVLGTVTVTITATATAALAQSGVYDVELVYGDGTVERVLQGRADLSLEVTR